MKETKYYCDLCGLEITERSPGVGFNNIMDVTETLELNENHAHKECVFQLQKSIEALEEIPF